MKNARPSKTESSAPNKRKFSGKSTSTEAQRYRIIKALEAGPKTSYDLRRIGCYQSAARIKELRDRFGYRIKTERVTLYDRDGYMHPNAARYILESKRGERAH